MPTKAANPARGGEAGSGICSLLGSENTPENSASADVTQARIELLHEEIIATVSPLIATLEAALALSAIPDDAGMIYALRTAGQRRRAYRSPGDPMSSGIFPKRKGRGRSQKTLDIIEASIAMTANPWPPIARLGHEAQNEEDYFTQRPCVAPRTRPCKASLRSTRRFVKGAADENRSHGQATCH
jgi:hypothetical protein